MRARAPGKVVISGAYSVLEGAPAIVSAVDRYVEACSTEPASFHAPEVACALAKPPYQGLAAPNYDASALRDGENKLGLGSSAAILLASLACLEPTDPETPEGLTQLFSAALLAHREAQGGGSGIDVACSCYGRTLSYQLEPGSAAAPEFSPLALPPGLHLEVWGSDQAASTKAFVATVRALKHSAPAAYAAQMTQLRDGAERVRDACATGNADRFLHGLEIQSDGFASLGKLAGLNIQTEDVKQLAELARAEAGCVLPAGAGGGDIALWAGRQPPSKRLLDALHRYSHRRLSLTLDARGVHRL